MGFLVYWGEWQKRDKTIFWNIESVCYLYAASLEVHDSFTTAISARYLCQKASGQLFWHVATIIIQRTKIHKWRPVETFYK